MPWTVILEEGWPAPGPIPWRLAMDVDPRERTVRLGPRVPGTGSLEVQSGAVARSFFDVGESDLSAAGAFLAGDEAAALLVAIEAGFHCHVVWTGDPVVEWTDAGWEAGHALWERVAARIQG